MEKTIKSISIYSICHFIVDFVSGMFVLGVVPYLCTGTNGQFMRDFYILEIILYNFFAFAFQVPMGFFMDKLKLYKYVGIIGFCMIGICYIVGQGNPFVLASIVGIGNGLFHLEGGVNAFNLSKGKAFLNGLFVAPGDWGVFLSAFFFRRLALTFWPIVLIMSAIILLLFVQNENLEYLEKRYDFILKKAESFHYRNVLYIIILIGICIIVRSIGGGVLKYEWKSSEVFWIGFVFASFVVLGKALGGLIGDKIGLKKTAVCSLILAGICLVIGFKIPLFGFLGIFLFNIPMSITLLLLEKCDTKHLATMVGSNTFFLFIGYLICFIPNIINNTIVLIVSIILAIITILCAFKEFENKIDG